MRTMKSIRQWGDVNKTAVVEARCDVRSLAGCYLVFTEKKFEIRSKSDLVRCCVDLMYEQFLANGTIKRIEEFDKAVNILSDLGYTSRDHVGARHISALVNHNEFVDTSINFDLVEAKRQIQDRIDHPEKYAKTEEVYISEASDKPELSPEASKPFTLDMNPFGDSAKKNHDLPYPNDNNDTIMNKEDD